MELRSHLDRMGNPLGWSSPAKVLLLNTLFVMPLIALGVRGHYLLAHPDVEPYINRAAFGLFWGGGFVFIAFSLAVGTFLIRAGRESRLFVHAANQFWWLFFGLTVYLYGAATTPLFILFPLVSLLTLLLFELRLALPGIITGIVVVLGTMIAERLGYLPYAPFFATWPEVDGRVANEWVVSTTLMVSFATALALVPYSFILRQWRAQSAQLSEMSEVLKQMFGRYMSREVMKKLLDEPDALALGGARRRVTMLLTDLRGFTSLAERLSPENVISLLNDYFEVMVDVCLRYNGSINEITGDALLVTFGAPQEMDDHAAAAVACAIEMQNAMERVNAKNTRNQRPELQMGIAVHTADVIVGNIGSEKRSKFGIVGSAVNMTSRIESCSVGGQVLASQTIVDEIGGCLRIDSRREFTPKGFSDPLKIYEIGGIGGVYQLALERDEEALLSLPKPVHVRWEMISDKRLDGSKGDGQVVRFSRTGLELAPAGGLCVMDDLRLKVTEGSATLTRGDIYAKVASKEETTACLRFTSIPPEILTYFEGLRGQADSLVPRVPGAET